MCGEKFPLVLRLTIRYGESEEADPHLKTPESRKVVAFRLNLVLLRAANA